MNLPAAIIFINADINDGIKNVLVSQLMINETMSGTEFDARMGADPNYAANVHAQNMRILVVRESFQDHTNRQYADVVMFVKQGQADILKNNFGPPGLSLAISRINVYEILRYNNSPNVVIIAQPPPPPAVVIIPNLGIGVGGIVGEELRDQSCVQFPNPDNEYNNPDFIKR